MKNTIENKLDLKWTAILFLTLIMLFLGITRVQAQDIGCSIKDDFTKYAGHVSDNKVYMSYAATAIKPAVEISSLNGTAVNPKSFKIKYVNNKNVGQASIIITGKKEYAGFSQTLYFTIEPLDISKAAIKDIKPQKKIGAKPKLAITIPVLKNGKVKQLKLKVGRDYTVEYEDNDKNTESAVAKVTGINNFVGKNQKTFTIASKNNPKEEEEQPQPSGSFKEGAFWEYGMHPAQDTTTGKWGYINQKGKWVIKPQYTFASQFGADGIASVSVDSSGDTLIDIYNKPVLKGHTFKFVYSDSYHGYRRAQELVNGKSEWVWIIKKDTGFEVQKWPANTYYADFTKEGIALVNNDNEEYAYVNTELELMCPFRKIEEMNSFYNGYASCCEKIDDTTYRYFFLDTNLNEVWSMTSTHRYGCNNYASNGYVDMFGDVYDTKGTLLFNVKEKAKPIVGQTKNVGWNYIGNYKDGQWSIITGYDSSTSGSPDYYNFIDESGNVIFENNLYSDYLDSRFGMYEDVAAIRICVDRDSSGKITGYHCPKTNGDKTEFVVMGVDKNIRFSFADNHYSTKYFSGYYTDGYAFSEIIVDGKNDPYVIFDKDGNEIVKLNSNIKLK